jgi:hypothetical protein
MSRSNQEPNIQLKIAKLEEELKYTRGSSIAVMKKLVE